MANSYPITFALNYEDEVLVNSRTLLQFDQNKSNTVEKIKE